MAFCVKQTKSLRVQKILLPQGGFSDAYAILAKNFVFSVFVFYSLRIGGA